MSFIRLLALSYLAWAAVFVVAVLLVAHLPLAGNSAAGIGAPAQTVKGTTLMPLARQDSHVMARLDLAPVAPKPGPVEAPTQADALFMPPQPRVVQEPQRSVIAAPPLQPREPTRANRHSAPARPAFSIPDPPPSSLANLPADLQPTASRNKKRASAEPAFHIPDPPPLEAGRL